MKAIEGRPMSLTLCCPPAHHDVLGLVCRRFLVQQLGWRAVACQASLTHLIQLLLCQGWIQVALSRECITLLHIYCTAGFAGSCKQTKVRAHKHNGSL